MLSEAEKVFPLVKAIAVALNAVAVEVEAWHAVDVLNKALAESERED